MLLLFIFVAIPVVEIALFITIGGWLTLWPTVLIVLSTGFLGSFLVKSQGLKVLSDLAKSQKNLNLMIDALANGGLIIVAGLFLITPGFFTDSIGFLLLAPGLRRLVILAVSKYVKIHFSGQPPHEQDDVVNADYRDVTPKAQEIEKSPHKD